jgi:hypothetical protein
LGDLVHLFPYTLLLVVIVEGSVAGGKQQGSDS